MSKPAGRVERAKDIATVVIGLIGGLLAIASWLGSEWGLGLFWAGVAIVPLLVRMDA